MTKEIVFINTTDAKFLEKPKPASTFIPDWYKEMESYSGGKKKPDGRGKTTATIKRCMPVFDAMTAGYIITLAADVHVSQKDGKPWYEWTSFNIVEFHQVEQAPEHPARNDMPVYAKFGNPWGIKTPKGYSSLFVQPFHRESPFMILEGIVDTDTYNAPVNFPFVLKDTKFEGMIPAGTPIAQVIPFKRENWKSSMGSKKDISNYVNQSFMLATKFFDRYKSMFRQHKEYK